MTSGSGALNGTAKFLDGTASLFGLADTVVGGAGTILSKTGGALNTAGTYISEKKGSLGQPANVLGGATSAIGGTATILGGTARLLSYIPRGVSYGLGGAANLARRYAGNPAPNNLQPQQPVVERADQVASSVISAIPAPPHLNGSNSPILIGPSQVSSSDSDQQSSVSLSLTPTPSTNGINRHLNGNNGPLLRGLSLTPATSTTHQQANFDDSLLYDSDSPTPISSRTTQVLGRHDHVFNDDSDVEEEYKEERKYATPSRRLGSQSAPSVFLPIWQQILDAEVKLESIVDRISEGITEEESSFILNLLSDTSKEMLSDLAYNNSIPHNVQRSAQHISFAIPILEEQLEIYPFLIFSPELPSLPNAVQVPPSPSASPQVPARPQFVVEPLNLDLYIHQPERVSLKWETLFVVATAVSLIAGIILSFQVVHPFIYKSLLLGGAFNLPALFLLARESKKFKPIPLPAPPPQQYEKDFDGEVSKVGENLKIWLPLKMIYEFSLGGLGLGQDKKVTENFYSKIMNEFDGDGPNARIIGSSSEANVKMKFFREIDALEDVSPIKKYIIKNFLYDVMKTPISSLIDQFTTKFKLLIEKAIKENAEKKFQSVTVEATDHILEFLDDLKANLVTINNIPADQVNQGGSLGKQLEKHFHTPPPEKVRNVSLPYTDYLRALSEMIIQEFNPKLNVVEDVAAIILRNCEIFTHPMLQALNPFIQLVVCLLGFVPFLILFLAQGWINFRREAYFANYLDKTLDLIHEALSNVEDKVGYTSELDKQFCELLQTALDAIDAPKPALPSNPIAISDKKETNLAKIIHSVWLLAPAFTKESQSNPLDFKVAVTNLNGAGMVDNIARDKVAAAGVVALNAIMDKYLKVSEIKIQATSILGKVNNTFGNKNYADENEKSALKIRKDAMIKDLVGRASFLGYDFGKAGMHVNGAVNLVSLPITWKYGLCIYLIGKPFLAARGRKV